MFLLFDIGGTKTRVGISRDGRELISTQIYDTPENFEKGIDLIKEYVSAQGISLLKVSGGIAGILAKDKELLIYSPNLPGWAGKNIKEALKSAIGTANVFIENDAALAGLGEAAYGVGKDYNIVAYLTISTGVGGARIVNKTIDSACYGFEPGHQIIKVNNSICSDDLNCRCDEVMSDLESYISGRSLQEKFGENLLNVKSEKVWERVYHYLAVGLHNMMVFWSPEIIVLGGGVVNSDSFSFAKVEMHLKKISTIYPEIPVIKKTTLGDFAGLYGALYRLSQV